MTGNGANILVTGATGFLGSHLTLKLVEQGHTPVILERDFEVRSYLIKSGGIRKCIRVRGELNDYDLLERIIGEYEISHIYHFAAQAIVGIANKAPLQTFSQNIMGTANLLEAARRLGSVKRILVTTSDKAYGEADALPYTEASPLHGLHPYACSKSCEDLICQTYINSYGMDIVIVRSGNMYGPGDLNMSRIIPKTICNLLGGLPPVIYGDGEMKRDYSFVSDVANACLFLMKRGKAGPYNVSGESVRNVNQVVSEISNLLNIHIPPTYEGTNNEIDSQWLDISKIKRLGWTPKHTFAEGLEKTI